MILLSSCQSEEKKFETAIHKATTWLWDQQSPDGGWHSQTHTVLQDGRALTPYILYHLLQISENEFARPFGGVERGVEFIRREIRASMSMDEDSLPMLNYPNYSAAYALKTLCFLNQDTALQDILVEHLLREQFIEHRGITSDQLAYGGWGYGESDLTFGEHGHVDVSHTRRIVEALKMKAEAKAEEIQLTHALSCSQIFLLGVQRALEDERLYEGCLSRKELPYDGGFISSTATLATNKSEPVLIEKVGYHYPSYATATCDGFLAWHALGMTDTKAYGDARQWLEKYQDMSTIDGLSKDDPEQWHEVMHYYHWAVRAEAMTTAGITGNWSEDLKQLLIAEQQPDGYYINPIGGVNKEDDPLLATIFAVQAGNKVKNEE